MRTLFVLLMAIAFSRSAFASVSFEKALDQILEQNTAVALQKVNTQIANINSQYKKQWYLPQVGMSVSEYGGFASSTTAGTTLSANGTVSFNIFKGGSDIAASQAADFEVKKQATGLSDSRLVAEKEAVQALIDQIQKQKRVGVLERLFSIFTEYKEIASERYEKGLLPQQEVDKISIDAENAKARLQNAKSELLAAQANVTRLLGHSDIDLEWPWSGKLFSEKAKELPKRNLALAERADYKTAVSAVQVEAYKIKQSYGLTIPGVDFSFSLGYLNYPGITINPISTSVTLNISIFDGFRDLTALKVQRQNYMTSELKLRQLQRDAQSQWASAKDAFETAVETAAARERTLKVAEKLYKTNLQRFKQGRASVDDLQVEHTRLIDAELLAIEGLSSTHLAFANLCYSLGQSVKSCGI